MPAKSDTATKVCSACKQLLLLECFAKNRSREDGLAHRCRSCVRAAYQRRKLICPPERTSLFGSKRTAESSREYYHKRGRFLVIEKKYGLTKEAWQNMVRLQDGRCAICGNAFRRRREPFVDHSHVTGRVRGLLCKPCNLLLGAAYDNPRILTAALRYLANTAGEEDA